jgi:hypothetical protein
MNDPKRLSSVPESDFEHRLLRAGRAGAPPGARQRALLAASAALATSSLAAGGAAAGHAATTAKAGTVAAFKWLSVLSLMGVGAVAGVVVVRNAHEGGARKNIAVTTATSRAAESTPAVNPIAILATPAPSESAATTAVPAARTNARVTARPAARSAEPSASSASTLPVELAVLEQARGAMGAGEPTRALSILDGYDVRFPRGAMVPEAAVLRVEALVKAGDRPAAYRFANAFLASEPRSPYAVRIQSLLAGQNP